MNYWSEVLWRMLDSKLKTSLDLVKIRAAIVYLKVIKGARHLTILFFVLVICVVVLACGFLLVPVALCLFMPWAPLTKAIVAASFGAAYILIPLIVVLALFSQKRWMKASKVDKLLKGLNQ